MRPSPSRPLRSAGPIIASTALFSALLFGAGCSSDDDGSGASPGGSDAEPLYPADGNVAVSIRRTTGGVAHIKAEDLASVAYGNGYVQAEDNVCVIAEAVVKARGERASFYGPGADNGNVLSDFSYRALQSAAGAAAAVGNLSARSRALLEGFVAGYNRYLADTDAASLPPACRSQPWVRPISVSDLYAHYRIVAQYASGDLFATGALLAAVPPGESADPTIVVDDTAVRIDGDDVVEVDPRKIGLDLRRQAQARHDFKQTTLASNAWGIGSSLSEQGRGALLANPHFPYTGSRRLYQVHLTVPGYLDVNGAGLVATAIPVISFNRHLAWSHTVSTSNRFTLYELTLADGDDHAYVKGDTTVRMTSEAIRIEVANGTPEPTVLEKTIYYSEYGPMLAADLVTGGGLPAWGANGTAYTYRDANASASGLLDTWLDMSLASSLEEFQDVFRACGSTLWTNTTYADDQGNAFYIDSSSVPHLSQASLATIDAKRTASPAYAQLFDNGLVLLDGDSTRDDWIEGDCNGRVPYASKPSLTRDDFVQNSNSSYWSANPAAFLTGFSPLFGTEETELNARTRLGLAMLQNPSEAGHADKPPAGQDGKFSARDLIDVIWNNRSHYAERVLPELRERCTVIGAGPVNLPGGGSRSVESACDVLQGWNGTYDLDSVGAHVFRVFIAQGLSRDDVAYSTPFDPADPVETPVGLPVDGRGTADDPVLQALATGLEALDASGIGYDVALGSVQSYQPTGGVPPNGEPVALGSPIPWHGGDGTIDGTFNAIGVVTSPLDEDTRFPRIAPVTRPATAGLSVAPGEGWPMARGTSWHFGLEFTDSGPQAFGLVSYSQSTDPASPWFVDQSEAYSNKQARPLLFDEADVAAGVLPDGELTLVGELARP